MKLRKLLQVFVFIVLGIFFMVANQAVANEDQDDSELSREGVFDLSQSIRRGLAVNPRLEAAALEVRKARSDKADQRGNFLPVFSVQSYWELLNSVGSDGPDDEDYLNKETRLINVKLSQPLFSGFSIFNVYQKAALNVALAEAWKEREEMRVVMDIHMLFLGLLKAEEDVASFTDAVRRLEINDRAARAFYDQKMVPYAQVLQSEVDLADARQQLSQAENKVDIHRSQLNILLGFSGDRSIEYVGRLEKQGEFTRSLTECFDYAYAHRPEMQIAEKSIKMAKKDQKIALGRFSPRLTADANYIIREDDYEEPGQNMFGTFDRDRENTYWTARVRLEWEFGLGGQQYHRYRKTSHEVNRLRQNRQSTRDQIEAEVRTYFMSLQEADSRIETSRGATQAAREVYDRAINRYNLRLATISELLDSQARLSRAEANHNQAIADYLLSLARLYHAMGWALGWEPHYDTQEQ